MHHTSSVDGILFRWQLQKKEFLTPLSYDALHAFNVHNGSVQKANISFDTVTGIPSVTIKELFWMGFGDLCYVQDQLVRPISNLWKGLKDPIPTAVKRLPQWIIEKYYPVFNAGNFTGVSHTLEEVGDCNTRCFPIPRPTLMRETEQGKNQFEAYVLDLGMDQGSTVELSERKYYGLWSELSRAQYCSPYITTY